MAQARLPMRKIRDVLRLSAAGLSKRQIAASLGHRPDRCRGVPAPGARGRYRWPLPDDLGDDALERRLYPAPAAAAKDWRSLPDWPAVHRELRRKGVTLQLVWEEYRAAHPDGYGRSRFCELYRAWEGRLSPTMRQTHVAGEKLFVDYAGTTIDIFDATTGEVHACQLFVAALGASSYTYAEATATQTLPDWIGSHTRAFAFFGGVPAMVVSDNLKSGITKACFYEPAVNRAYAEMAAHYDTAIVPARPRKPRDKAKVEVAVLVATRWIIAKLRNRQVLLARRVERGDPGVRRSTQRPRVAASGREPARLVRGDSSDRRLKPLPASPYVYAEWKQCKVGLDYHVEVEKHYYSVPHALLRETLWARITARTIELFHRGKRVAVHVRSSSNRKPHDGARAHAVEPPALCRLDAGAHPATGRRDRAEDIGADRDHPARADASRAGLPRLDRHPAARQELRP